MGGLNLPVVIQHIDFPAQCFIVFLWSMVLRVLPLLYEALPGLYVFSNVMPAQRGLFINCIASV